MHVEEMLRTHPDTTAADDESLLRCILACYDCAQACTSCADACLSEPEVDHLRRCIRLDLDCADICAAAGAIATRQTGGDERSVIAALEACAAICDLCGHECQLHAGRHAHCRICADACRRCEQACREALLSLANRH